MESQNGSHFLNNPFRYNPEDTDEDKKGKDEKGKKKKKDMNGQNSTDPQPDMLNIDSKSFLEIDYESKNLIDILGFPLFRIVGFIAF